MKDIREIFGRMTFNNPKPPDGEEWYSIPVPMTLQEHLDHGISYQKPYDCPVCGKQKVGGGRCMVDGERIQHEPDPNP